MGADIYFQSKINANRAQSDVYDEIYTDNAYFRDSYNGTSLYWLLGRSWWQDVQIVEPSEEFRDEEGELTEAGRAEALRLQAAYLEGFRAEVETFPAKFEEWLKGQTGDGPRAVTIDEGQNSPTAWREMFEDKLTRWIALQEAAIKLGEPLRWSV